jgi:hypothetical protein
MCPKDRPLLLIDVDGVVSLFGFDHAAPPPGFPYVLEGIPHWLSDGAGPCLERLSRSFECVWCTGWEERAEEHLPRRLGLPGGWRHLTRVRPTLLVTCDPAVGLTDEDVARLEAWAQANGGH